MERKVFTIRIDPSLAQKFDAIAAQRGIKSRTLARQVFEQAIASLQNQKPA